MILEIEQTMVDPFMPLWLIRSCVANFLEDIQVKYNIVLSMKELTSASEVWGHVDW